MDNNRPLFDRRMLVAMLVAFAFMQAWFWFVGTQQPKASVDTDAPVATAPPPETPPVVVPPPPIPEAPARTIPFQVCRSTAAISTDGGSLTSVQFLDYQGDYHVTALWSWAFSLVTGPRVSWLPYDLTAGPAEIISNKGQFLGVGTGDLSSPVVRLEPTTETPGRIVLGGKTADGLEITRTIVAREDCTVDVETTWHNPSADKAWKGVAWLSHHDLLGGAVGRGRSVPRPAAMVDHSVHTWDDVSKEDPPVEVGAPVQWLGIADHYFAAFSVPEDEAAGRLYTNVRKSGTDLLHGTSLVYDKGIAAGASLTEKHRLYLGPKAVNAMLAVDPDLGKSVDLGWFGFFGRPVFLLLNLFHTYTGSWGLSIVLLTFVIKTLFFPLTAMAFRSGLKMQAIQPRIAALKEELKDNPEELNRRTMALFSQHGVNPVGGCLPSLAQVPVWMALGNVLYYSVELYHSKFLYLKDLSSLDPYGVLPVLVVALQLLLQRMMPTANMDPQQARMMQWMPVFLAFLYFSFPSGLMVYIFCNLLLTIVQQAIMKRVYHPPVLPA